MRTLTYRSVRRATNRQASGRTNSSQYDKKCYVIHYRNLQQCTRHGLRIAKIHRVLQFSQSPWLRTYIELNMNFRILAKNDFEKNLYKLMNNACLWQNLENVHNHVNVRLVTQWEGQMGRRGSTMGRRMGRRGSVDRETKEQWCDHD